MDIFNLLFSIIYIFMYIFLIILEIIFGIIVFIQVEKSNKKKVFIAFFLIVTLTLVIFYIKGTPNPKIDISRKLKNNELVGKWDLTYIIQKEREKADKYYNYIKFNKNGLCKFSSIDYNSSKYMDLNCQWSLKYNIKADNSLYKDNVVVITFNDTQIKRYFYFMQQDNELILYNYYLNDWYNKIEYRKEK